MPERIAWPSARRCAVHRGELLGLPSTGRYVTVNLLNVIRIENGRFAEQRGGPDLYDLLRQLGAAFISTKP